MSVPKVFNINQKSNFIQQNKTILKNHKRYNLERSIMSEMNYSYDAKFEVNILIVGRTGCGKNYLSSKKQNEPKSNLGVTNTTFKGQRE